MFNVTGEHETLNEGEEEVKARYESILRILYTLLRRIRFDPSILIMAYSPRLDYTRRSESLSPESSGGAGLLNFNQYYIPGKEMNKGDRNGKIPLETR